MLYFVMDAFEVDELIHASSKFESVEIYWFSVDIH